MALTTRMIAAGLTLVAFSGAAPALPATDGGKTLSLICRVRESLPNGRHRELRRRLDLDLQAKSVAFRDDTGKGWRVRQGYHFVSANADRIVLEAGGGKESYVDRRSGQYYFHNSANGLTIRGPCAKAAAAGTAF
jgi:hypothetical protein